MSRSSEGNDPNVRKRKQNSKVENIRENPNDKGYHACLDLEPKKRKPLLEREDHVSKPVFFELFQDLPLEIQTMILGCLNQADLINFSQINHHWNQILCTNDQVWQNLCRKRWPGVFCRTKGRSWRQMVQHHHRIELSIRNNPTPGAAAITMALEEAYGIHPDTIHDSQAHYHAPPGRRNQEPVDTITIVSCDLGRPHWHYITWGLSELNQKDSSNPPETSGWGIELSFRLAKTPEEINETEAIRAPDWPIHFVQSLARYICRSSNVFGNGDHMPLSKPWPNSKISALLFTTDPILRNEWKNPNGDFTFIQIFGVTEDEVEAAVSWNKKSFLQLMAKHTNNELLITDLSRQSVLDNVEISRLLKLKTEQEGSTQGLLFVEKMRYLKVDGMEMERMESGNEMVASDGMKCDESKISEKMILEIPPMVIPDLLKMLKGRIFFHRDFFLVNSVADFVVSFLPSPSTQSRWDLDSNQLTIVVSYELALQLQTGLVSELGEYQFSDLKNFVLRIVELNPAN